jgi:hypothetical protein
MRIRDLMEVFFGHQAGEAKGAGKQTAPFCSHRHRSKGAAPLGTDDGLSLHDPAPGRAAYNVMG